MDSRTNEGNLQVPAVEGEDDMSYIIKHFEINKPHTMVISLLKLEDTHRLVTRVKLRR